MPVFTEFVLVAIALFLWESTLWLPLRGVALRRRWSNPKWRILRPGNLIATRELGMVPMLPLPPDGGLAPCQAPPLVVTADGTFLMETGAGELHRVQLLNWDDLKNQEHHLVVDGLKTRISSPRCIDVLRRAKQRGATPEAAVGQAWRLALSPARAGREWRRWKLVSRPLRWYGHILTLGGFDGLPLAYLHLGTLPTLMIALWLWFIMGWTAAHLWWLGKRVYPCARSALRMDAVVVAVGSISRHTGHGNRLGACDGHHSCGRFDIIVRGSGESVARSLRSADPLPTAGRGGRRCVFDCAPFAADESAFRV
jgi:hypothetical protein